MARIRTVKPEFWTAEQVMELSPMARLLFIGMWNFCDDRGVHPVAYKTLKAEVFPADDLLSSDIERMVGELIAQGLLSEFEADGRRWWFVTGWSHQVINRPSKSRYPEPPRDAPPPSAAGQDEENEGSAASDCVVSDDSVSAHASLTDGREGRGGEGKGVNHPPHNNAGARSGHGNEPGGAFAMQADWQPSGTFSTLAHQAGLPAPGGPEFETARAEFVSYWMTRNDQRSPHEWDHAFIRSLKNDRIKAQASPPGARASPGKPSRHRGFENLDYRAGVNPDGTF